MFSYPLLSIYEKEIPKFLLTAVNAPPVQRLQEVGMNCGCEYTAFPLLVRSIPYSRYDHSLGTALIVWHFTHNEAQALSGLFHDISTPTFAHVIDFLKGDYLVQETTEEGTAQIIRCDATLQELLNSLGLQTEDVSDYHRYPIADNDSPRLSADRLEYSLGNMLNYRIRPLAAVQRMYDDLIVSENEDGVPELAFLHSDTALDFSFAALSCGEIYVSDEDRYTMQRLAELIREAVSDGVISESDLYRTEPALIAKLNSFPAYAQRWAEFRAMNCTVRSKTDQGGAWRKIHAKKRCIDPLIVGAGRVSAVSEPFRTALEDFLQCPQDCWILGFEAQPEYSGSPRTSNTDIMKKAQSGGNDMPFDRNKLIEWLDRHTVTRT